MSFVQKTATGDAMLPLPMPPARLSTDAALFLDFDGTLVELAETPAAINVAATLKPLLGRLQDRLAGRLAIISGRSIEDLDRHLGLAGFAVSGSHGLEVRRAHGDHRTAPVPAELDAIQAQVRIFAADWPGLLVEDKPAGVALHFRKAPEAAQAVHGFMQNLASEHGLRIQRGAMVVELRPKGADKGDALRAFMREPVFAGSKPLFVGDDLTDEHAFVAAAELGGAGVLVGPERPTAAGYRLPSVAAVTAWLEQAA